MLKMIYLFSKLSDESRARNGDVFKTATQKWRVSARRTLCARALFFRSYTYEWGLLKFDFLKIYLNIRAATIKSIKYDEVDVFSWYSIFIYVSATEFREIGGSWFHEIFDEGIDFTEFLQKQTNFNLINSDKNVVKLSFY